MDGIEEFAAFVCVFFFGILCGFLASEDPGRGGGRAAMSKGWIRCPSCGAWHSGKVCEPCERKNMTEWTVKTNQMRKPKWWR